MAYQSFWALALSALESDTANPVPDQTGTANRRPAAPAQFQTASASPIHKKENDAFCRQSPPGENQLDRRPKHLDTNSSLVQEHKSPCFSL